MSPRETTSPAELAATAEALYRDYLLPRVRRWKERTSGLAIGYMPIYVPRELLHAQGVLPVAVLGGGDDLEIIRGDAFYQSYICHIPRSTIELGLNGSLDVLDGMLFPAICDVIRNLSGIWKMQFPDKLVRYLDVPQNFDRSLGGTFYRQRAPRALDRARRRTGRGPSNDDGLRESIAALQREPPAGSSALRAASEPALEGADQRALLRPAREPRDAGRRASRAARGLSAGWRGGRDAQPMDQARVLLTGPFCEQPPLGLIKTLERAGCYIVDDDFVQVAPVDEARRPDGRRPARQPGRGLPRRRDRQPDALHRRGRQGRGAHRAGRARAAPRACSSARRASAIPRCSTSRWRSGASRRKAIPWTAFKYAENGGQFQVIREQAGTFADSIKLWSEDRHDRGADAQKDASQLRQKEMIAAPLPPTGAGAGDGREDRLHLRAGQPHRAPAELRPPAGAARDQRPAVGDARASPGEYIAVAEKLGHSEDVCTYVKSRHGHDEVGQHRSHRRAPARSRRAAPLLHRVLHLHEVVRDPARAVPRPGRDASRALSGRRRHHRLHARVRRRSS